jgi:uncharacterized protein YgiM (DUF1202 family)
MKKNFWLIIGLLISSTVWADQAVPAANPEPAKPRARKPAARSAAKSVPVAETRTVPLVPGPAIVTVSPHSRVNVRGQGKLNSEIITHMTNGESVSVIEEIHLTRSAAEEPSAWARIVLPEKAHVWVNSFYVDQTNNTVRAKKLNLRSGPGENFSVVGSVQQGDPIKEISRKNPWIEIENPGNAYAFMAAQYLRQEPVMAADTPAVEPVSPVSTVTDTPAVAGATTDIPADPLAGTNQTISAITGEVIQPPTVPEEPPPPRIVQREGIVRGTFSIQAPTRYELISAENRKTINYLHTTADDLDLSRYKGLHIIVTGEEGLDARWKNTPVITIQRIQVLD